MSDGPRGIRLEIEGVEVPTASVWVHHRRDPYPGGLRYRLSVPKGVAAPWIGRLLNLGGEGVVGDRDRGVLMAVAGMLSWGSHEGIRGGREHEKGFTHVLNTVDVVAEGESDFTIGGICSPFIRG